MNNKDIKKEKLIDSYEKNRSMMIQQGYEEHICTISIIKANLMALVTAGPIAVICFIMYMNKWQGISFSFSKNSIKLLIIYLAMIFACFAIHEIIHGITWGIFCKNKWKSIHLGVMWSELTPYCHCKEPLRFGGYILGGLMPLLILGIGFFLISYFTGNVGLMFLSLINILGAGGDTTIALMLLKYRKAYIVDHPTECGFVAFTKAS